MKVRDLRPGCAVVAGKCGCGSLKSGDPVGVLVGQRLGRTGASRSNRNTVTVGVSCGTLIDSRVDCAVETNYMFTAILELLARAFLIQMRRL